MKTTSPACLIITGLALLAALAGRPCARAAAPATDNLSTTQRQIDALLKHRLKPEPLPVDLPNPFLFVSGGVRDIVVAGGGSNLRAKGENDAAARTSGVVPPAEPAVASSAEMLAGIATKLRIGGIIRIKDQFQLVINDAPRKEGDLINAEWNNLVVQLRITRILPGLITLRYADAEITLKF